MAMRLFLSNETDFTTNGHKYIESIFTHEIRNNSEWYLDVRVPLEFIEFIEQDNIVVVKTKEKGKQPFRIKDITVGSDIRFEAWHIGFDTKVYTVSLSTVINLNCQNAINEFLGDTQTNNFTSFSDISGLQTFSIINMTLYEALIDVASRYNGFLDFDGWQIRIVSSIGSDKGVTIAYGKNLESAEVEERWDMVCTELQPLGNNGLVGSIVYSSIQYDRPYAKIVSFDTDDLTTLNNLASAYVSRFESPQMYYKVSANVDGGLGDTIQVKARQFTVFTQVLGYKFNIKTQQMIEIEFGNFRPTVKNAIGKLRAEVVEQSRNITQLKIDEVNGEISTLVTDVGGLDNRLNSAETSITQQANAIELKASQSTVDGINTRLNTAEQLITPTAITQTVRSSTEYTNDLGAKENTVFKQNTAPAHVNGRLWLNTSVTPNVLNRSNGTAWVRATPTQASEVGAYSSGQIDTLLTSYSTITQTANDITLAVSTASNGTDSVVPYDISRWEQGAYNGVGAVVNDTTYIRTKPTLNIPILPNTDYILSCSTTLDLANTVVYFYTSANAFISSFVITGGERRVTSPSNAAFIRARARKSNGSIFSITEMPNHWVRVTPVGKFLKGSKFEINGEKIISQADGIEFQNASGTPVVFFDTVNNRFTFNGHVLANTGTIGRFAISDQDLVYTSELFDKDYDRSDVNKLHRILLGIEPQTPYDLAVYDVNNNGTLTITDLVLIDAFVQGIGNLPTPRRRIRSVVRIGTNNGALTIQAVAENGSAGPTTTIRGEKITGDLINTNSLATKIMSINGNMVSGGIEESGSNANGKWVKYSDGTLICYIETFTLSLLGFLLRNGDSLRNVWTFPAEFVGVSPSIHSQIKSSNVNNGWFTSMLSISAGLSSVQVYASHPTHTFSSGNQINVGVTAIGRWK